MVTLQAPTLHTPFNFTLSLSSLVPRPHRHLQERTWYLSLCEHDGIRKWQKLSEQTGTIWDTIQLTTHSMHGVYDSHPSPTRYVWLVTWCLCSSCCSELHTQLNVPITYFIGQSAIPSEWVILPLKSTSSYQHKQGMVG